MQDKSRALSIAKVVLVSTSMKEIIYKKLSDELRCEHLEVIDESHLHAGHAGNTMSGESHFRLIIKSEGLSLMPKVQAHRKIYEILAAEIPKIHALAIEISKV